MSALSNSPLSELNRTKAELLRSQFRELQKDQRLMQLELKVREQSLQKYKLQLENEFRIELNPTSSVRFDWNTLQFINSESAPIDKE